MHKNKYVIIGFQEKDETDRLAGNLGGPMNDALQLFVDAIKGAQARLESETLTKSNVTESSANLRQMVEQATARFEDLLIGSDLVTEKRQSALLPFVAELQKRGCPDHLATPLAQFVLDRILQAHDWVMGYGNCWAKLEGTKIRCAPNEIAFSEDMEEIGAPYVVEVEFTSSGWVLNSVAPIENPSLEGKLGYEFSLSSTCCSGREMICPGF